jgi:predicted MFS family arabinose efflux permease
VVLEPFIGWRALFLGVALLGAGAFGFLLPHRALLGARKPTRRMSVRGVLTGYRGLLGTARGLRTYGYVLWNGIFHSGVFTWLGLYFSRRYGLGEVGIGLAILGYGIPGFLLGPLIGRLADRWGRRWLVPAGFGVGAVASLLLMPHLPLLAAALAVTVLSLGYDMTQPLLAGIVTALGGKERGGQAMGLNVFMLFTGFGIGSYLFGEALRLGFGAALAIFTGVQVVATLAAVPLFRSEARASLRKAPEEHPHGSQTPA